MTNEEVAKLVEQIPQGLTPDEFLVALANKAAETERKACAFDAEWCIQNGIEHHIPSRIRARK